MIKDKDTWKKIPRHPGYWMSRDKQVGKLVGNSAYRPLVVRKIKDNKFVKIVHGQKKYWEDIEYLYSLVFPIEKKKYTIKHQSGEGRKKLDRLRVYSLILRFMPDVQIPVTPNGHGKFETSPSMKEKGMLACDVCGHIQAVELKQCKECENFITE